MHLNWNNLEKFSITVEAKVLTRYVEPYETMTKDKYHTG